MKYNICTATDSYKFEHWNMYPENTERIYSYLESRMGSKFDETVFFGLQYFLKEYLVGQIVTEANIRKGKARVNGHMGSESSFNEAGWRYILDNHNVLIRDFEFSHHPKRKRSMYLIRVAKGVPDEVLNGTVRAPLDPLRSLFDHDPPDGRPAVHRHVEQVAARMNRMAYGQPPQSVERDDEPAVFQVIVIETPLKLGRCLAQGG